MFLKHRASQIRRTAEEEVQEGSAEAASRMAPNVLSVLATREKASISLLPGAPMLEWTMLPASQSWGTTVSSPRPLWGPALPAGSHPGRKPQGRSAPFGGENTLAHRPTPAAQSTPDHECI